MISMYFALDRAKSDRDILLSVYAQVTPEAESPILVIKPDIIVNQKDPDTRLTIFRAFFTGFTRIPLIADWSSFMSVDTAGF